MPKTSSETMFDHLGALAAELLGAPMAFVTMMDEHGVWCRSAYGAEVTGPTPHQDSFCAHAIALGEGATLVIEDAKQDPTFERMPSVQGDMGLRFYAGAVISRPGGGPDGAICVVDTSARPRPSEAALSALRRLAHLAAAQVSTLDQLRIEQEHVETIKLSEALSGVGRWRLDIQSQRIEWSPEVYRIHGFEPGEADPAELLAKGLYTAEDNARVLALIEQAVASGEGYDCELVVVRPDGVRRTIISKAQCELDELGRVRVLFGVVQDVTTSRRAGEAIAASEARYRLLATNATDIILRYKPDGTILYLSPAVETILGRAADDMVGHLAKEYIFAEDQELVRATVAGYFAAGPTAAPPRFEYRGVKGDGSLVWLEASPRGVWDENGLLVEMQDHIRDVSERKRLEVELTDARNRAEDATRAKSEFLANMSHELRTPLTSVIGFTGLLLSSSVLPDLERRYADRIGSASEALLSVINDVLDYSKLEAGAVEAEPLPFDPRRMAQSALDLLDGQAGLKGIRLTCDVAADVPQRLVGDEGRLRQVLLNLASNAVKFTREGEIKVSLSAGPGRSGQIRLRACVSDTGIGIPAHKISMLFERFTQADASTTRNYGGTGLGLAISHRLITLMGGEMGADSQVGRGSTFWFELPLPTGEALAPDEIAPDLLAAGTHILVVDDSPANRELLTVMLESLGLSVETASNGAEAVDAVTRGAFDCVLMDVQMPIMDGLAATAMIRGLSCPAAETPILALTANVQTDQVARCIAAGMDGHVAKPVNLAVLVQALSQALGSRAPEATKARRA